MAISRNGWDVYTSSSNKKLVNFPWITGRVRNGDHYVVLNYLAERFNRDVEPIRKDWSWGYAYRDVRGVGGIVSEHATGTAVDFNAPAHPIGKKNTFSVAKRGVIRQIVKDLQGSVRWGGEWSRPDDMHFELVGGNKKVGEVAALIRAGKLPGSVAPVGNVEKPKPTPAPKPKPKPSTGKVWPDVALKVTSKHTTESHNAWVKLMADVGYKDKSLTKNIQRWLKDLGYYKGHIDGDFGGWTVESLQEFLVAKGHLPNKAYVDRKRGSVTIKAEIAYLNSQRKFY